jgi:hypothetical protein
MLCYVLRLVDWCDYYCGHQLDNGVTANPIKHQLFYASCQVCYAIFSAYLTKQEKKLVKCMLLLNHPCSCSSIICFLCFLTCRL